MTTYYAKLKHPLWQRRRLERLKAASYACRECGSMNRELHVHHTLYRRGHNPWDYADDELVVFCVDCHQKAEQLREELLIRFGRCSLSEQMQIVTSLDGETARITNSSDSARYVRQLGSFWFSHFVELYDVEFTGNRRDFLETMLLCHGFRTVQECMESAIEASQPIVGIHNYPKHEDEVGDAKPWTIFEQSIRNYGKEV